MHVLWALLMSTHNTCFMENWRKLSQNYHQILLFNKSAEQSNFPKCRGSVNLSCDNYYCSLTRINSSSFKTVMPGEKFNYVLAVVCSFIAPQIPSVLSVNTVTMLEELSGLDKMLQEY